MDIQRKGGKKYRKFGRNSRPSKHRAGTDCGLRNCHKLRTSRIYDPNLKAWLSAPIGRGSELKPR